jgi:superfamily II DNA helicase RecQ
MILAIEREKERKFRVLSMRKPWSKKAAKKRNMLRSREIARSNGIITRNVPSDNVPSDHASVLSRVAENETPDAAISRSEVSVEVAKEEPGYDTEYSPLSPEVSSPVRKKSRPARGSDEFGCVGLLLPPGNLDIAGVTTTLGTLTNGTLSTAATPQDFEISETNDRIIERVIGPLVYARGAEVMVCCECKIVVLSPACHLASMHDFKGMNPHLLERWPVNKDWKPDKYGENDPLPCLEVKEGLMCVVCSKSFLDVSSFKRGLCACGVMQGCVDVLVQQVSTGHYPSTVRVKRSLEIEIEKAQVEDDVALEALCFEKQLVPEKQSSWNLNQFFKHFGWWLDPRELEQALIDNLAELFVPRAVGLDADWEQKVELVLHGTLEWCESPSVSAQLRLATGFRAVQGKTKRQYVTSMTSVLAFAIGVHRKQVSLGGVALYAPFADKAEALAKDVTVMTVFDFVYALMDKSVENRIVEFALRVHSIDVERRTLKDPRYIQPLTSRIMKFFRATVLVRGAVSSQNFAAAHLHELVALSLREASHSSEEFTEDGDRLAGEQEEATEAEEDGEEGPLPSLAGCSCGRTSCACNSFESNVARLAPAMLQDCLSVMMHVVSVKVQARHYSGRLAARIMFNAEGTELSYNGKLTHSSAFQTLINSLTSEAHQILDELLFGLSTEKMQLRNFTNGSQGNAFQHMTDNKPTPNVKVQVLKKLLELPDSEKKRIFIQEPMPKTGTGPLFKDCFRQKILEKINRFESIMLVLIHLTSGLPARAPELASLQLRAATDGSKNMFFEHNRLCFEPSHSKSNWTGVIPVAYRSLSPELSQVLLQYLCFVRPFAHILCTSESGGYSGAYETHLFVWRECPMQPYRIRRIFNDILAKHGICLEFGEYRQAAKAIYNRGVVEASRIMPGKDTGAHADCAIIKDKIVFLVSCNREGSAMFDHSEWTGTHEYGRTKGTEAPGNPIQREVMLLNSEFWRGILASHGTLKHTVVENEGIMTIRPTASVFNPGPRTSTVINTYNINVGNERLAAEESFSLIKEFQKTSYTTAPRRPIPNPEPSADSALRLFSQCCEWKSAEQKLMVEYSLEKTHNVLAVLPTAGGKSLAFFLPCMAFPAAVFVVLVPTLALQEDIIKRARELGISSCDSLDLQSGLVVLTYAQFQEGQTVNRILDMAFIGRVLRVFVDEAHTLFKQPFQRPLEAFPRLFDYIKVTFLTATMTLETECALKDLYNLKQLVVVRARTDRENLIYSVVRLKDKEEKFSTLIKELTHHKAGESDRIIVFVPFVGDAKRLKSQLAMKEIRSTLYFGSQNMDRETQSAAVEDWRKTPLGIMIATSAFSLGVDYSAVRLVIVYGLPYSVEEFAQQAGRAGRDQRQAKVVLLYSECETRTRENLLERSASEFDVLFSRRNFQELATFIRSCTESPSQCVRVLLTEKMDSFPIRCSRSSLCSSCTSERSSSISDASSAISEKIDQQTRRKALCQQVQEVRIFQELIESSANSPLCARCVVNGSTDSNHHLFRCRGSLESVICESCHNVASAVALHSTDHCPFKTNARHRCCSVCLLPPFLENVQTHDRYMGPYCQRFNLKAFFLAVKAQKGFNEPELRKLFAKFDLAQNSLHGIVEWFVKEYVLDGGHIREWSDLRRVLSRQQVQSKVEDQVRVDPDVTRCNSVPHLREDTGKRAGDDAESYGVRAGETTGLAGAREESGPMGLHLARVEVVGTRKDLGMVLPVTVNDTLMKAQALKIKEFFDKSMIRQINSQPLMNSPRCKYCRWVHDFNHDGYGFKTCAEITCRSCCDLIPHVSGACALKFRFYGVCATCLLPPFLCNVKTHDEQVTNQYDMRKGCERFSMRLFFLSGLIGVRNQMQAERHVEWLKKGLEKTSWTQFATYFYFTYMHRDGKELSWEKFTRSAPKFSIDSQPSSNQAS